MCPATEDALVGDAQGADITDSSAPHLNLPSSLHRAAVRLAWTGIYHTQDVYIQQTVMDGVMAGTRARQRHPAGRRDTHALLRNAYQHVCACQACMRIKEAEKRQTNAFDPLLSQLSISSLPPSLPPSLPLSLSLSLPLSLSAQNVSPQIHCLMVQAMADWYMQGEVPDPSKMSRILDITQDTKVHSYGGLS